MRGSRDHCVKQTFTKKQETFACRLYFSYNSLSFFPHDLLIFLFLIYFSCQECASSTCFAVDYLGPMFYRCKFIARSLTSEVQDKVRYSTLFFVLKISDLSKSKKVAVASQPFFKNTSSITTFASLSLYSLHSIIIETKVMTLNFGEFISHSLVYVNYATRPLR